MSFYDGLVNSYIYILKAQAKGFRPDNLWVIESRRKTSEQVEPFSFT